MDQPLGGNSQAPTALAAPERNQYFQGELLDVPHLQLEQGYLNAKRWLMNRLINGSGVVTGLAVAPAAGGTQLVVQAGVAIDGWGREIVVPSLSVPFDPRILTGDDGSPSGTVSGSGSVAIGICYQECGIDACARHHAREILRASAGGDCRFASRDLRLRGRRLGYLRCARLAN
jgi:hypothetical protein